MPRPRPLVAPRRGRIFFGFAAFVIFVISSGSIRWPVDDTFGFGIVHWG